MKASRFQWGRLTQMLCIRFAIPLTFIGLPAKSAWAQASPDSLWTIGNCNLDERFDLADSVMMLGHLFAGGNKVPCTPLCDVTGDGRFNLADPISVLSWLFNGVHLPASTPLRDERCDGIDNDCDGLYDEDCSAEGLASVSLAWDPVSQDVVGDAEEDVFYRIYVGTRTRQYTDVRNVGQATSYRVYGLVAGVQYFIALTALDQAGNESGFSNEIVAIAEETSP